jgi:hypothetical protein
LIGQTIVALKSRWSTGEQIRAVDEETLEEGFVLVLSNGVQIDAVDREGDSSRLEISEARESVQSADAVDPSVGIQER